MERKDLAFEISTFFLWKNENDALYIQDNYLKHVVIFYYFYSLFYDVFFENFLQ